MDSSSDSFLFNCVMQWEQRQCILDENQSDSEYSDIEVARFSPLLDIEYDSSSSSQVSQDVPPVSLTSDESMSSSSSDEMSTSSSFEFAPADVDTPTSTDSALGESIFEEPVLSSAQDDFRMFCGDSARGGNSLSCSFGSDDPTLILDYSAGSQFSNHTSPMSLHTPSEHSLSMLNVSSQSSEIVCTFKEECFMEKPKLSSQDENFIPIYTSSPQPGCSHWTGGPHGYCVGNGGGDGGDSSGSGSDNDDDDPSDGSFHHLNETFTEDSASQDMYGGRGATSYTLSDMYTLSEMRAKHIKKYNTDQESWSVQFKSGVIDEKDAGTLHHKLLEIFNDVIDRVADDLHDNDKIRFVFQHPALDRPINMPLMKKQALNGEQIISEVEKVIQSNEGFCIDENFQMDVIKIRLPRGEGYGRRNIPIGKLLANKKSVVTIKTNDTICLARALVVARAKATNDPNWKAISDSRPGREGPQGVLAVQLCEQADVSVEQPAGIPELRKFQEVLNTFQIVVLSKQYLNGIIYAGPTHMDDRLYLYHNESHFDVITSITGFLSKSYYCTRCEKGFSNRADHCCKYHCKDCYQRECQGYKQSSNRIFCPLCQRTFGNNQCYMYHLQKLGNGRSICEEIKKCKDCHKIVRNRRQKDHHCGEQLCQVCSEWFPYGTDHQCFMMPLNKKKKRTMKSDDGEDPVINQMVESDDDDDEDDDEQTKLKRTIYYFDIEADNSHVHKCNCICVKDSTGDVSHSFYGVDALTDFTEWMLECDHSIFIAHNFSGYDAYFIMEGLTEEGICPKIVPRGGKILSLEVPGVNIKFIDSYSFVPVGLRKLPSTFGFENNILKKGDFPHRFNRPENQTYSGKMPDKAWWNPDQMNEAQRKEFESWYSDKLKENYIFNFKNEILSYCQNDVEVLRVCINSFQREFIATTGVDPFECSITIASACMRVFREKFLKENTIAVIPANGFKKHTHSLKAVKWLIYEEFLTGNTILHARNGGEQVIAGQRVDGWCEQTKQAYQLMGCFWHGCPKCYSRKTLNSLIGETMGELYDRTMSQLNKLEQSVKVKVIWEHDWDQQVENDDYINIFLQEMDIKEPLVPKDAFFGGRTEAIACYCKPKEEEGERICYADFMSLYPSINKYGIYPVGYPKIFVGREITKRVTDYFGLAKVKILPPRDLYIPVLPYRYQGKLFFPLCKRCVEEEESGLCKHPDGDRILKGTYVINELEVAIEKGYTVCEIEEIWHWEDTSRELFKDYVNTFLVKKIEASGWPADVKTENEKNRYIHEICEREQIEVQATNIRKNAGKRFVAKLCLNSFWGKLAQSPYVTQSSIIDNAKEYFDLVGSEREKIHDIFFLNDDILEIRHSQENEFVKPLCTGNTVLASFTTAQARIKLYKALDKVKERALYMDTDSLIYISNGVDADPETGNALGDLQNELDTGEFITTFYAGGAKNYGYITNKENVCLKVRGFTLNREAQKSLNLPTLITNVLEGKFSTEQNVYMGDTIKRDFRKRKLVTVDNRKMYRMVFNKRVLNTETYKSVPYGYIE